MKEPEPEIDSNMVSILEKINSYYPELMTVGSCGGHKEPQDESQVGEDEFYVQFIFNPDYPFKKSWDTFHYLVQFISESEYGDDAWVKIEVSMALMAGMFFVLRGHNVDPNEVF